jgi:23S rRNA (uracil1939-C5)-methyltransferase
MLGDVGTTLSKINDNIDTIIVDPPRAGLDNKTKEYILNSNSNKIIYVSCDPITLARDIKDLSTKYNVTKITGLDLFSYTYHCESITILEKR